MSKKFDVIWMKEAFHYLEPRDEILDKLKNITRKGGYLFIYPQKTTFFEGGNG